MRLPKFVYIGPRQRITVREARLNGKLGYFDPNKSEIVLESKQPQVGKHSILLHELIHVAECKARKAGTLKSSLKEEWVQEVSGLLFLMLSYSGLWKGMSRKHARRFYAGVRQ